MIEDNASCYLKPCTSCICTAPPNRFDLKMHWFSAPSRNNNIKICISTKKIKRIKFKVNQPIKHPEWHWHASVAMHGKQPTSNEVPGKCERASRSWPDMAPAFALMGKTHDVIWHCQVPMGSGKSTRWTPISLLRCCDFLKMIRHKNHFQDLSSCWNKRIGVSKKCLKPSCPDIWNSNRCWKTISWSPESSNLCSWTESEFKNVQECSREQKTSCTHCCLMT